jgi:hypothetical protein
MQQYGATSPVVRAHSVWEGQGRASCELFSFRHTRCRKGPLSTLTSAGRCTMCAHGAFMLPAIGLPAKCHVPCAVCRGALSSVRLPKIPQSSSSTLKSESPNVTPPDCSNRRSSPLGMNCFSLLFCSPPCLCCIRSLCCLRCWSHRSCAVMAFEMATRH